MLPYQTIFLVPDKIPATATLKVPSPAFPLKKKNSYLTATLESSQVDKQYISGRRIVVTSRNKKVAAIKQNTLSRVCDPRLFFPDASQRGDRRAV